MSRIVWILSYLYKSLNIFFYFSNQGLSKVLNFLQMTIKGMLCVTVIAQSEWHNQKIDPGQKKIIPIILQIE